jgi:hypothetical protein
MYNTNILPPSVLSHLSLSLYPPRFPSLPPSLSRLRANGVGGPGASFAAEENGQLFTFRNTAVT